MPGQVQKVAELHPGQVGVAEVDELEAGHLVLVGAEHLVDAHRVQRVVRQVKLRQSWRNLVI